MSDARERHSLVYSTIEVEAVVMGDGECEVNFIHDGVCVASFGSDEWKEVTEFVDKSWAMTSDA